MKEDNKKVIMIEGKNSEWYEKAIFIVRDDINTNNRPVNLVSEAEKIINSYMVKTATKINEVKAGKIKPKNDKKLNSILSICLILSFILLAITVYKLYN